MTVTAEPLVSFEAAPFRQRLARPRWLTAPVALGLALILLWCGVAATVGLWAPYDPLEPVAGRLREPSLDHPMGTDALGRDVLTRTLYGARTSIPVAAVVITVAVVFGCFIGALAGFNAGWADSVLMRAADMTLAFPPILLAMLVTASLGPGIRNSLFAMVVVWWPIYARLLRAQVLTVKEMDHVLAATSVGVSPLRLLIRHILPLSMTPVLVNATMDFGQVVLLSASLSFIGLGAVPPQPEWGSMITDGAVRFYDWWIAAAPGIAILSVVLAFNFVGDGIRDFLDPRTRSA